MRRIAGLSLAALFMGACSEPTTPAAGLDLAPSYRRKTPPPPPVSFTPNVVDDFYDFELGAMAEANSHLTTEIEAGTAGIASDPNVSEAPSGERFFGRLQNTHTQALLVVPVGGAMYSLAFDLYTIGSWDGKGRQAQQGTFQANIFSVGYRCDGATGITDLFSTTFSNQLTVQQDYPLAVNSGGGARAATGSTAIDALGYREHPELSNTPTFRSFGDVTYQLAFSGNNPCAGIGDGGITFILGTLNPTQQNLHDESWGIDNVEIKSGS